MFCFAFAQAQPKQHAQSNRHTDTQTHTRHNREPIARLCDRELFSLQATSIVGWFAFVSLRNLTHTKLANQPHEQTDKTKGKHVKGTHITEQL